MKSQELILFSELATIKPVLIKDALLICPGIWNEVEYTKEELKKAFSNTDWTDKSSTHLYLDHQDTPESPGGKSNGVANWAGFVKNVRLVGSDLYGDLELWNLQIATYLKAAKAKFGISATLKGFYNEELNRMENFRYESFSIVTTPAVVPAYINLAKEKELLKKEKEITATLGNLNLIELKGGLNNNMPKEAKKLEEEAKEESKEESESESKQEAPVEEKASEEAPAEDLSAKAISELTGKFDVLSQKFDKFLSIFEKSLQEEKAEEPAKEEKSEEAPAESKESSEESNEDELSKVKKELSELRDKIEAPVSKTLSSSTGTTNADANVCMLNFLKQRSLN